MINFFKIRHFWGLVILLLLMNLSLLIFANWHKEANPADELRKNVEASILDFEKLSFWERLLLSRQDDTEIPTRYSAFDGLPIDAEYEEQVVSVMIDNHALARDGHSGIREASIVYEALVEGGITRIMLIFPYQELDRVGPARSARDYFVDFSEEFGGIYMHAGGSPAALMQLWSSDRVLDLDEDDREIKLTYSYRDEELGAPHNLFVDPLLARERAEELGWEMKGALGNWCFNHSDVPDALNSTDILQSVKRIDLNFSYDITSSYYVQFRYDQSQNNYKRYYGHDKAIPHIDQYDSLQVAPTNIIVQFAPSYLISGDEKERLDMQNLGHGKAFYYMGGKKYPGSWKKPNYSEPTSFLDEDGQPICLNPGQSWIAVLDTEELIVEK